MIKNQPVTLAQRAMFIDLVPFECDIIKVIEQATNPEATILLPGKYLAKMFPKHKSFTYNEAACNPQIFGIDFMLDSKLGIPSKASILPDIEFSLLLRKLLSDLNLKLSLQTLRRAVNEFFYYDIDINALCGDASEAVLRNIIQHLERHCDLGGTIPKAKLLSAFSHHLSDNNPLPSKGQEFSAILPILYNPSLWKLLVWLSRHHSIWIFIHTDLKPTDISSLRTHHDSSRASHSLHNRHDYLHQLFEFLQKYSETHPHIHVHHTLHNSAYDESKQSSSGQNITNPHSIVLTREIRTFENRLAECSYIAEQTLNHYINNQGSKIGIIGNDELLLDMVHKKLDQKMHFTSKDSAWDGIAEPHIQNYLPTALVDREDGSIFWLIMLYSLERSKLVLLSILKHPLCIAHRHPESVWQFEVERFRLGTGARTSASHITASNMEACDAKEGDIEHVIDAINNFANIRESSLETWCSSHWQCYEAISLNIEADSGEIVKLLQDIIKSHNTIELKEKKVDIINDIADKEMNTNTKTQCISKRDYSAIIQEFLHKRGHYREKEEQVAQIEIMTPIEARLRRFDYVIFCGLNEGSFPFIPPDHHLISTHTRKAHGYESPALYEIGYGEHDFQAMISSDTKILLTCNRVIEPTRWLQLLQHKDTMEQLKPSGVGICNRQTEGEVHMEWAQAKSKVKSNKIDKLSDQWKASITAANVPLEVRPRKVSATAITKLLHNPYCYYAEYILALRKMRAVDEVEDSGKNFGIMLHELLAKTNKFLVESSNDKTNTRDYYLWSMLMTYREISTRYTQHKPYLQKIWQNRIIHIGEWLWDNKPKITSLYSECRGEMVCKINHDYKIIVEATIDRLDIVHQDQQPDEGWSPKLNEVISLNPAAYGQSQIASIIDYKTGYLPSKYEVASGIAPQLILEGIILQRGKLPINDVDLRATLEVNLTYIQLNGRKNTEKEVKIDLEAGHHNLMNLIQIFYNQEEPYVATQLYREKMYKHLART